MKNWKGENVKNAKERARGGDSRRRKPKKPKNQRLPLKGKTFQQPRPMTHYEEEERHRSNHECWGCIRKEG